MASNYKFLFESYLKGLKNNLDDLNTFIEKRKAGAQKIAESSDKKGKFATLTAIHFKAKEVPYKLALTHVSDKDSKFIEEKADECFKKLKDWKNMSQREFQHVMGQLEAFGEVYIRSTETKLS